LTAANGAGSERTHQRLVLIDGDELTKLLVRYNVGVRTARAVEIKRIDLDYFAPEED
jgi:restriction system protein